MKGVKTYSLAEPEPDRTYRWMTAMLPEQPVWWQLYGKETITTNGYRADFKEEGGT